MIEGIKRYYAILSVKLYQITVLVIGNYYISISSEIDVTGSPRLSRDVDYMQAYLAYIAYST